VVPSEQFVEALRIAGGLEQAGEFFIRNVILRSGAY
jgi:hypothetical protein